MTDTQTFSEAEIKAMVSRIVGAMQTAPPEPGHAPAGGVPSAAAPAAPVGSMGGSTVEDTSPAARFAVPHPANGGAYLDLLASTPARIGEWRAGPRPTVASLLRFRADHAGAMDAVFNDVPDQLPEQWGLLPVQSAAPDKQAYLMDPSIGARFTPETAKLISERCAHGVQVQVIVSDGLSSAAVVANVPDVLPSLLQGLQRHNLTVGTNLYVKYGRVRIMDEVTALVGSTVTIILVGERPGLVTNESLSCYMTYRGHPGIAESARTVVSNIYRQGTPPVEAGAYLADIARKMLDAQASGMDLRL